MRFRILWILFLVFVFAVSLIAAYSPSNFAILSYSLATILLVYWIAKHPKSFLLATIAVAVFAQTAEHLLKTSSASYVDDFLVLCCIVGLPIQRIARGQALRAMPGIYLFLGFAIFGLFSSLIKQVPVVVLASGMYLSCKAFLLGWSAAQLDWQVSDLRRLERPTIIMGYVLVIGAIVNAILPAPWAAVFSLTGSAEFRGPIVSLQSLFVHPSFFGQIMGGFALLLLAYRQEIRKGGAALLMLTLLSALLTFRRKTAISVPLGWIRMRSLRGQLAGTVVAALIIVPVGLFIFAPQVSTVWQETYRVYFEDPGENARSTLTIDSIAIANENIPIGAGFGRYGSSTAAAYYSPEYSERGYQGIFGLEPNDTNFASDTFWPSVLGETGWIGFACYVSGIIAIGVYFKRGASNPSKHIRFISVAGSGWLVMLLVESIAAPVLSGPPTFPFVFCAAGVLRSLCEVQVHSQIDSKVKQSISA